MSGNEKPSNGNGAQPAVRPGFSPGHNGHRVDVPLEVLAPKPEPVYCAEAERPLRHLPRWYIPLVVLSIFAVLFVGWEVIEQKLIGPETIGLRHFLLTVRAAVVTAVASFVVYVLMRRQQHQLVGTAEKIAGLLEAYRSNSAIRGRFENPNLLHCKDVLDCSRTECPMYEHPGERCWQTIALRGSWRGPDAPPPQIHQCHTCAVYLRSCPDALTKLGESFNNLMFLLEEEAAQVGRMRAQLVEKEKMVAIGQMASGIAHEIGNPLSSISSIVQMLHRHGKCESVQEELDLIQTHIQRISSTVRQLGTLARPSPQRWEKAGVDKILDDAVRLISFDRRARHVEIRVNCPSTLPWTYAHRGRLQQVFINLLLNALDAMPNGGTLTVNAAQRDGIIQIEVGDTGPGIDASAGRRIFEPFFTTKEPGRGTGLGLSVSYGIVREHGGNIDFVSAPNHGTTFTVELPVQSTAPDS